MAPSEAIRAMPGPTKAARGRPPIATCSARAAANWSSWAAWPCAPWPSPSWRRSAGCRVMGDEAPRHPLPRRHAAGSARAHPHPPVCLAATAAPYALRHRHLAHARLAGAALPAAQPEVSTVNAPDRIIPIVDAARRVTSVRASSWGSLFDCAHKWEAEHLLGMRKASGLRAQLGTAIHASTAAFDTGRIDGKPVSVDDAAGVFVDKLHHPERDVDYSQDDLTVGDAEKIGLQLHTRYCLDLSPRFLFRSVEATLQPLDIDCGGGIVVRLPDTMDRARVASTPRGAVIPDIKTGSRVIEKGEVKTKGRSAQLGPHQLISARDSGEPTAGA